jgi:hypothetical protein
MDITKLALLVPYEAIIYDFDGGKWSLYSASVDGACVLKKLSPNSKTEVIAPSRFTEFFSIGWEDLEHSTSTEVYAFLRGQIEPNKHINKK